MTDPASTTVRPGRTSTRTRRPKAASTPHAADHAAPLDWPEFESRLTRSLSRLPRDQYLILETDAPIPDWNYYVQFAQSGPAGFLAEAVSNEYLGGPVQLSPAQEATLLALGWQTPSPHAKRPENHRRQWPLATPFAEVAALAVHTLRDVYGVERPDELRYRRFHRDGGGDIAEPTLGIAHGPTPERRSAESSEGSPAEPSEASSPEHDRPMDLPTLIANALDDAEEIEALERRDDDFWRATVNGTQLFVRILPGDFPPLRIYGSVAELPRTPELLVALNELNASYVFGRTLHVNREVFVAMELPARAVNARILGAACEHVARQVARVLATLAAIANPLQPDLPVAGTGLLN